MERALLRTPGRFLVVTPSNLSVLALADGSLLFIPWDLSAPLRIDQTVVEVTTVGGAGSITRCGWFRDDGTLNGPGALISDVGTVDTTVLGVRTIPHAAVTLPAGRVWAGVVNQGAAVPTATLRCSTTSDAPVTFSSLAGLASVVLGQVGVTGALPANPATNFFHFVFPSVGVRIAA